MYLIIHALNAMLDSWQDSFVISWTSPCDFTCYVIFPHGCRADTRFTPSQWEMSLQGNTVSHWLGANLRSALGCKLFKAYRYVSPLTLRNCEIQLIVLQYDRTLCNPYCVESNLGSIAMYIRFPDIDHVLLNWWHSVNIAQQANAMAY